MPDTTTLEELLAIWQRERAQGRHPTAQELCPDRPELILQLEQRIASLNGRSPVSKGTDTPCLPVTLDCERPPDVSTTVRCDAQQDGVGSEVRLPGYEILSELGRGQMGVVYKARQIKANRIVAIKMILSGSHASKAEVERFRTEAEAIARVQHPNVVQVFEVGEHEGRPFFSLEFCPCGNLENRLGDTPLSPTEAALTVASLARGVQAAHARGVVHRDLKPANVLVAEDGTLKVTDFGLAKKVGEAGDTIIGSVMGTPNYMAPEQAAGRTEEVGCGGCLCPWRDPLPVVRWWPPLFRALARVETLMQVVSSEPAAPRTFQPATPIDLGDGG